MGVSGQPYRRRGVIYSLEGKHLRGAIGLRSRYLYGQGKLHKTWNWFCHIPLSFPHGSFPGRGSLSLYNGKNGSNFLLPSFIPQEEGLYLEGIYSYKGYWQKRGVEERAELCRKRGCTFLLVYSGKKKEIRTVFSPTCIWWRKVMAESSLWAGRCARSTWIEVLPWKLTDL